MSRDQPGEFIVHGHDGFVCHAAVRIRHQLGRDVDDARAQFAVADVLEQKVFIRQLARYHFPAGALAWRSSLRGSHLEARWNVVVMKVDEVHCPRRPNRTADGEAAGRAAGPNVFLSNLSARHRFWAKP
jgi:hypothetical protein